MRETRCPWPLDDKQGRIHTRHGTRNNSPHGSLRVTIRDCGRTRRSYHAVATRSVIFPNNSFFCVKTNTKGLGLMAVRRFSIEGIRAELAWVNEPVDPWRLS